MAKALQHDQAALIAGISTAGAADDESIPDTRQRSVLAGDGLSVIDPTATVAALQHQAWNLG